MQFLKEEVLFVCTLSNLGKEKAENIFYQCEYKE